MRKLLLATAMAVFGLGFGSANADVTVTATIDKDKDVGLASDFQDQPGEPNHTDGITEHVTKNKTIDLVLTVTVTPDKAAESLALINQTNNRNDACSNCAEKRDEIIGSISSDTGIVDVNQASGNMNNQGNAISVAVDFLRVPGDGGDPPPEVGNQGFAEAQSAVDQVNGKRRAPEQRFSNTVDAIDLFFRDALIDNSIINNTGIVNVNQSPGNMANQANALSFAVSFADDGGVALSEADLGQINQRNRVRESGDGLAPPIGINKSATITGSINGNQGVVTANQSSGNMANQANNLSLAVVQF